MFNLLLGSKQLTHCSTLWNWLFKGRTAAVCQQRFLDACDRSLSTLLQQCQWSLSLHATPTLKLVCLDEATHQQVIRVLPQLRNCLDQTTGKRSQICIHTR